MSTDEKYCPYCGSMTKSTDVFCNNCGASLEIASDPIVSTPEQQIDPFASHLEPSTAVTVEKPSVNRNHQALISLVFGIISASFFFV